MRPLTPLTDPSVLPGPWCNGDAATTACLEAISLVTPVLERFFIQTVASNPPAADSQLAAQCRAFIHEEAAHTGAHRQLNQALLAYLHTAPPGLATLDRLGELAHRHLPRHSQMALVAALEHCTAVVSQAYNERQAQWQFSCTYAQELFAEHAREEIDHRAVAFDLWQAHGGGGLLSRLLTMTLILCCGGIYLSLAVPWILRRKCGSWRHGLRALLRRDRQSLPPLSPRPAHAASSLLRNLSRYFGRAYHPYQLVPATVNPPLPPATSLPKKS
jgi:predicted metal-dependent hydrolase